MISNSYSLNAALNAYAESVRSRTAGADETSGTASPERRVVNAPAIPESFKTSQARQELQKTQTAVAKDLRMALTNIKAALKGEVSFSMDAKGALTITGSEEDKALVTAALKADRSNPSLQSRIMSLSQRAETVESDSRRSAAIMQAARSAGNASGLMSLYNSLMTQKGQASATFTVSAQDSRMVFKGMIDSKA